MFYPKFAFNNLKHSKNVVLPFLMASTVLFLLNCVVIIIMFSPILKTMQMGGTLLGLAIVVLVIFSTIMEIYSYQFLLKQRNQEYGLYNILGMNKKQIAYISSLELLFLFILTLIFGSIFSFVFAHLFYLIFANLTHYDQLKLAIQPVAFIFTSFIYLAQFGILFLIGLWNIRKTSALDLFRNQSQGEKEPKENVLLAILSILSIGIGYFLSISSTKVAALAVVYRFFVAVIFVIIGTYLFYISFMTWYLKRKKANKRFYYQPEHFISTSQMIFRMKQNAVGLANITLLAVMAFVSIATTTALYTNTNQMIAELFPKNTSFNFVTSSADEAKSAFKEFVLEPLGKKESDSLTYESTMFSMPMEDKTNVIIDKSSILKPSIKNTAYVYFISEESYKKLGYKPIHLKENEVALYRQKRYKNIKHLNFIGKEYKVRKQITTNPLPEASNTYNPGVLVVKDDATIKEFIKTYNNISDHNIRPSFYAQLNLSKQEVKSITGKPGQLKNNKDLIAIIETKTSFGNEMYGLFGGFLFTGFILGLAFILGAALIIYYKQYSEGLQDKKSYKILQEVGMSAKEIEKTINSQVLIVFFMPITIAVLHFSVSMIMLKQMLLLFGVQDSNMIYIVSATTIGIIIFMYFMIYKLTSRAYYKIIER